MQFILIARVFAVRWEGRVVTEDEAQRLYRGEKFPIGELARRRRLLRDGFVENSEVYLAESSKLKKLKRKVFPIYILQTINHWLC